MHLDLDQEDDGRWLAAVPDLPGVLAYGTTPQDARNRAVVLALRVLADRIEHHEPVPDGVRDALGLPTSHRPT